MYLKLLSTEEKWIESEQGVLIVIDEPTRTKVRSPSAETIEEGVFEPEQFEGNVALY